MHTLDENIILPDLTSLFKAFELNNAILFAGAGISISAGFPDWKQFIIKVIEDLEQKGYNGNFKKTRLFVESGDFLLAAELIKEITGKALSSYIEDYFSNRNEIGLIHNEIPRVPFSFAITTNFDSLLELAYGQNVYSYTWQNIGDFFRLIKKNKFCILKLHGEATIDNSHIIAKNDFNGIMKNYFINSVLLSFFSQKTILFLGYSFRDPDILKIMEEGKSIFGQNFGPHYILMFESEIDSAYINFLKINYNLFVIICKSDVNKTNSILSFLRFLSGKASLISNTKSETILINNENFNFQILIKNRLIECRKYTGSTSAFLFTIDERIAPALNNVFIYDSIRNSFLNKEFKMDYNEEDFDYFEIIRDFYYAFEGKPKFLYIPDSSEISDGNYDSDIMGKIFKYNSRKLKIHKRSILLVQVYSDGFCVGILGIETTILDAYTDMHLKILKDEAVLIGALFRKLEIRTDINNSINLKNNISDFCRIMNLSIQLNALNLKYLIYEIDYKKGQMRAIIDENTIEYKGDGEFLYNFDDHCFAGLILNQNSSKFIVNIESEIGNSISINGIEAFSISKEGPLFGTPLKSGKYTNYILVAWPEKKANKNFRQFQEDDGEAITRLGNLILNSALLLNESYKMPQFQIAEKFINQVNEQIDKFKLASSWLYKMRNSTNRTNMLKLLLNALINTECDFKRVRVYIYLEKIGEFLCICSVNSNDSLLVDQDGDDDYGTIEITELEKRLAKKSNKKVIRALAKDEYCQFTLNRFVTNPYSLHQHRSMFRQKDINSESLSKPENARWIVCPISRKNKESNGREKLLGFVSADNLIQDNGKLVELIINYEKDYFQRYALDLIVNLINPIIKLIIKEIENDLNNILPRFPLN